MFLLLSGRAKRSKYCIFDPTFIVQSTNLTVNKNPSHKQRLARVYCACNRGESLTERQQNIYKVLKCSFNNNEIKHFKQSAILWV